MFIRCGHFIGTVAPENRQRFDAAFDGEIVPALAKFPGVQSVKVLRACRHEAGAPPIYQTVEMIFESLEAIATMEASPERAANAARLGTVMELFEGQIFHVVYALTVEA